MQAINSPRPTHSDMVLVPTQGRETVQQDVADVRAAQRAQRMGPSQGPQWVYDGDDTEEE